MKASIKLTGLFFLLLSLLFSVQTASADFGTLFTTASERQIINDNRYAKKKVKQLKTTSVAKIEVEKPQEIIYKIIKKDYKISGISIANNGVDSAWINGKSYESGEFVDKKIKISINAEKRKVRFTVRGGKTFYGQSGDTVIVSYRVPLVE